MARRWLPLRNSFDLVADLAKMANCVVKIHYLTCGELKEHLRDDPPIVALQYACIVETTQPVTEVVKTIVGLLLNSCAFMLKACRNLGSCVCNFGVSI